MSTSENIKGGRDCGFQKGIPGCGFALEVGMVAITVVSARVIHELISKSYRARFGDLVSQVCFMNYLEACELEVGV